MSMKCNTGRTKKSSSSVKDRWRQMKTKAEWTVCRCSSRRQLHLRCCDCENTTL